MDASAQTSTVTGLRIGVVAPATSLTAVQKSALEGIRLGATEAGQTARLFGSDVQVFEAHGDGRTSGALPAARFLSSARKVQVLIAIGAEDVDSVAKFAEDHRIVFFNIVARNAAARSACRRHTFHIEASDIMYSNARTRFAATGTGHSNAAAATSSAAKSSTALWDPHLQRFGASQLNDRYAAAAHRGMDGPAWAGWAAVKIASETALRAGSADPVRMLAYLEAPTTQFDGHKGWPLSFRIADHQLRQPLYIVVPSSGSAAPSSPRVIDVPDLRSVSTAGSDRATIDALDRLSAGSTAQCAWSSR